MPVWLCVATTFKSHNRLFNFFKSPDDTLRDIGRHQQVWFLKNEPKKKLKKYRVHVRPVWVKPIDLLAFVLFFVSVFLFIQS